MHRYVELVMELQVLPDTPVDVVTKYAVEAGYDSRQVKEWRQDFFDGLNKSKTIASFTVSSDLKRIQRTR